MGGARDRICGLPWSFLRMGKRAPRGLTSELVGPRVACLGMAVGEDVHAIGDAGALRAEQPADRADVRVPTRGMRTAWRI